MWREFAVMGFKIVCKAYDEGSKYGLAIAPRISKMSIYSGEKEVFNYDRGMDFTLLPEWLAAKIIHMVDALL